MRTRTRRYCLSLLALLAIAPPLHAAPAASEAAVVTPRALPGSLNLIPAPAQLTMHQGERFQVSTTTALTANTAPAARVARQFSELLVRSGGPTLAPTRGTSRSGIRFQIDPSTENANAEGYVLDADSNGVVVRARTEAGLFYGATTLAQLLTGGSDASVPALTINDAPRFVWRGFMLDSARHFQSVDDIKQLLDTMASQKLNTFHWHLTDDQGWRIEIKRYPKLTSVGSCRIPAGDGGRDPVTGAPRPYCGFYTQQQIRDVVAYAAALHIDVVPEIDVPGHATAAIAAYPQLGVIDTPLVPSNEWGVFANLFNVEEDTFVFLENVLEEIIPLFPARYVHVGGDEAVKDQWIASARVQQRMRELGAHDEMQMQSHLIKRLEKFLHQHDRQLIGWDEILEGGLPPEATVMSWRGIEGGLKAASEGHDVVMSPTTDMYMDYLQTASPNEPPGRPARSPRQRVYDFEPVPAALAADKRRHILGLQANMFTEHTRYISRLHHNVFPRLAAVAETGWSPVERRDYADFLARLPAQLQRYQAMGIGYARTPFEVMLHSDDDRAKGQVTLQLSNPLNYAIHYSLDGSAVTAQSPRYTAPLRHALPVTLQAAAFFNGKPLLASTTFNVEAAGLLTRRDDQLQTCPGPGNLLLRLEDDGPLDGERAIFNVDIFHPCWRWPDADLSGIASLRVRAGQIPYYFQLAHDEPARRFVPALGAHGELQVLGKECKGKPLVSVPLPPAPGHDGFIELQATLPAGLKGRHDICLQFTGDTRPHMWVLDQVSLQPR